MTRTILAAAVLAVAFLLSLSSPADAQSSSLKIYWVDRTNKDIKSANLDGSGVTTLVDEAASADLYGIAVDSKNGKVYWLDRTSGGRIRRADIDGSNVTTVLSTSLHGPYGLAVNPDSSKIYWTNANNETIGSANLDGSSTTSFNTSASRTPYDLVIDIENSKVYWTGHWDNVIGSANLDGSGVTTLIGSGIAAPHDIAFDPEGDKIYWVNSSNSIKRADADGSNVTTIVNSGSGTTSVAVDTVGDKIYWSKSNGEIKRASLDGSGTETIGSGLGGVGSIAISAPTNIPRVTVTSTTDSTVLLDWNDIEDATDYQYRHKLSSETDWGAEVTTGDSTALLSGLLAATEYDFQARSRESGTPNDWSTTLSVTTKPRSLAVTRWPDRVGDLVVVSQGSGSAQLQWQHQIHALDFDIGLWQSGQMDDLSARGVTATVSVPEVWEQISTSVGVWSSSVYPEFDDENPYIGTYEDDPNKVILLQHYRYTGDILYYWNTALGIWRVLRCANPSNGGCDYGTPSSTDTRTLQTISSSSTFTWFNLDDGPANWGGVYRNEDEALESAVVAGAVVIFLDPLNYARFSRLNTSTPSATVSDLPEGRQYLAVRGVTNDGRKGAWSYLVAVGTELSPGAPQSGEATVTTDLIYTDELIVSQHYIYDEDTLLIQWPSLVGARHYDIRLRGTDTQRIAAAGGAGQEIGLDVSNVSDSGIEYELRGVVMAGTLSYDIIGDDGRLLYIVPPGPDRVFEVERLARRSDH